MTRAPLISILIGCALLCGCGDSEPLPSQSAGTWLLAIEQAHARADAASPAARDALEAALALPVPAEVKAEHSRVVHQDLLFRLARIELAGGRSVEALTVADRGLTLGRAPDLFAANLLVARGEALETLGRKTEAAASYFEALEINRKLLHDALAPTDAGSP
jgi:predicted negative regulator of RcsB-dependent stress response